MSLWLVKFRPECYHPHVVEPKPDCAGPEEARSWADERAFIVDVGLAKYRAGLVRTRWQRLLDGV